MPRPLSSEPLGVRPARRGQRSKEIQCPRPSDDSRLQSPSPSPLCPSFHVRFAESRSRTHRQLCESSSWKTYSCPHPHSLKGGEGRQIPHTKPAARRPLAAVVQRTAKRSTTRILTASTEPQRQSTISAFQTGRLPISTT